ncbi:MAG: RNA polymerase sigma-70 factor [Chitinophagaceae bacterium]
MNISFTQYTDQELLGLMQKGDEKAFTELYYRYYKPLCHKAFQRIPSLQVVEEIVQDVFVNSWMKATSLDTTGNIKAYLYATLRNKILHELRTEQTRALYAEKIKLLSEQQENDKELQAIYAKETEDHINEIISTLSPQCRVAFVLNRYEHLSYKEVANRMHISVNTVEKHVGKALRVLKSKLNEYGDIAFIGLFFICLCDYIH